MRFSRQPGRLLPSLHGATMSRVERAARLEPSTKRSSRSRRSPWKPQGEAYRVGSGGREVVAGDSRRGWPHVTRGHWTVERFRRDHRPLHRGTQINRYSRHRANASVSSAGAIPTAPAAVRVLDLDRPLSQLGVPAARPGGPYRSVVVIPRLDGQPLGAAVLQTRDGTVTLEAATEAVRAQLEPELREALKLGGYELPPSLPSEGFPRRLPAEASRRSGPWVTVVVTTCRSPGSLHRCVRSLLESAYDSFDIVVVENRPGACVTSKVLAEHFSTSDRITYIEESRRGLSWARNAGLAHASGASSPSLTTTSWWSPTGYRVRLKLSARQRASGASRG